MKNFFEMIYRLTVIALVATIIYNINHKEPVRVPVEVREECVGGYLHLITAHGRIQQVVDEKGKGKGCSILLKKNHYKLS